MDRVMNTAPGPTIDGAVVDDFPIFLWAEGHQFHVRENHLLDDLPRFAGVEWRLERRSRQDRVNLGQAMGADTRPVLPADHLFEYSESRGVVWMPLHRRREYRPHALRIRCSRSSSIAFTMSYPWRTSPL